MVLRPKPGMNTIIASASPAFMHAARMIRFRQFRFMTRSKLVLAK